ASFERALSLDGDHGGALLAMGSFQVMRAYRNGDDPSPARALLQKAFQQPLDDGEAAKVRFFLGLCLRAEEREDEAKACFREALELSPRFVPAQLALAGQ
ncbi:tetratricopeptide repeat protein, partial [bacterium AH-315-F18]|nr:tetratricopeptide repeat protein [bacterium AH-315-F18]